MSYKKPEAYGQGTASKERVEPYHTERITYHAGNGKFGVQKKNEEGLYIEGEYEDIDLPTFVVLDDSMCKVVGKASSPMQQSGKPLVIFKDGERIAQGKWADVKDKVKLAGGKYSVQAFVFWNKKICLMPIKGTFLRSYINYMKEQKIKPTGGNVFTIESLEKVKGEATYFIPQFSHKTFEDAYGANLEKVHQGITERWDKLQDYFVDYFAAEEAYQAQFRQEEEDDFPEPNHQDQALPDPLAEEPTTASATGEEPFDLDDMPF